MNNPTPGWAPVQRPVGVRREETCEESTQGPLALRYGKLLRSRLLLMVAVEELLLRLRLRRAVTISMNV
jgi:hypothetical protein